MARLVSVWEATWPGSSRGPTKVWKFNTYGMTSSQAAYLASYFTKIAEENRLAVHQ